MRELRLFIQFIEKDYLFKLVFALALFALVPFAEIMFFLFLTTLLRNWLVMVLALTIGLPGVLVAQGQLQDLLPRLREKIRDGRYPGPEFVDLLGVLVSGLFLLTPGFLTDVLGYLLLVPAVRGMAARALARRMGRGLRELSDYLRLREL